MTSGTSRIPVADTPYRQHRTGLSCRYAPGRSRWHRKPSAPVNRVPRHNEPRRRRTANVSCYLFRGERSALPGAVLNSGVVTEDVPAGAVVGRVTTSEAPGSS
ncbi:hypothetical protein SAMN04487819_10348 [Actinopolyspora alba]|uniref:Uncharacterized protein n=1 Tax=Actinopolyspora alba TaxID=673379 RepID=A0A1I1V212_9ACTN|nr:hypothetical protein SAMN04487819_10348 [Actinopolyspora alba]